LKSETLIAALYVFALAAFLGYQVISRVPPLLHTPLMSATNAISGISLVGSIVTASALFSALRLSRARRLTSSADS
jgi:NAD(P) transhydrogenase subunit alpha